MRNIFLLLLFFVAGCIGDYRNDMNNGYAFVRTNADNHSISDKNHSIIVETNIVRYIFNDYWIIGFREISKHSDDPFSKQPEGYFSLKASNGNLSLGMTESEMRKFISDKNLDEQVFKICTKKNCRSIDSVLEIIQ